MPGNLDWVKPKDKPLPEFYRRKPSYLESKVVDMAKLAPYKVEVKIVNVMGRGLCAYGHMPGDTFIFDGDDMQVVKSSGWCGNVCASALSQLLYEIPRYMWGAYMPEVRGDADNKIGLASCGDLKSQVIFQLRRIKKPESPYFKKSGRNK